MRLILLLFFFVLIASGSKAQEYDYVLPDSLPDRDKRNSVQLPIKQNPPSPNYLNPAIENDDTRNSGYYEDEGPENPKTKQNRTSVGLELGSSVSSDFKGNTAINTYAAPHVRHEINDEVAVSGGVIMSQTFFDGWKDYRMDGAPMPSSMNTNYAYGRLDYKLSERMSVYGTVFTNVTTMPMAGQNRSLQGTGYSLGMEYKISERSFLQVNIQRSSGYNPFMPFNNNFGFGGRPFSYFP